MSALATPLGLVLTLAWLLAALLVTRREPWDR